MKQTIFTIVLLLLPIATVGTGHAEYTLFARPQITPQWVTVHGATGPETRLNQGNPVNHPATFGRMICRAVPFSPYSTMATRRYEVWTDSAGTTTDAQVLTACNGLKAEITAQIKEIRKEALDKIALAAGVLAVYSENYAAATAYKSGLGASTIMKDGQTAATYLTGFGAQLGMTPGQFADYIIAENKRVGPTAYEVEQQYLWFAYSLIPTETHVDELLTLPDQYRRYCGL